MVSHIRRAKFCNLRRLNALRAKSSLDGTFQLWEALDSNWYDFRKVNIFLGENGSGKSTVLELIDFLRDPSRLSDLARENRYMESLAAFVIEFESDCRLHVVIEAIANRAYGLASNLRSIDGGNGRGVKLDVHSLDEYHLWKGVVPKFVKNINCKELDNISRAEIGERLVHLRSTVFYCQPAFEHLSSKDVESILNDAEAYLPGVLGKAHLDSSLDDGDMRHRSFLEVDKDTIGVYLSDDTVQFNNVKLSSLPSGWKQLAYIVYWLRSIVADGAVCLIEEPETHLHPHLQRYLARVISEIVKEKELQLFVTTHSSVFQNQRTWNSVDTEDILFFEATADRLEKSPDFSRILDRLGYLNSDILQSNGVIWVEGPSDRIYLKYWLSRWCEANGKRIPVEHVEYSFCFYGGAILSHFEVGDDYNDSGEFVKLVVHNRNFAIVMDSDNDYEYSAENELTCLNLKSFKNRILAAPKKPGSKAMFWITHGYTIENYLPEETLARYFDIRLNGGLYPKSRASKVQIAARITNSGKDMLVAPDMISCLTERISLLYSKINEWNCNDLD